MICISFVFYFDKESVDTYECQYLAYFGMYILGPSPLKFVGPTILNTLMFLAVLYDETFDIINKFLD